MPTLKHKLPSYRKHKRSGLAVVTLNGRDIYLGKFGSASSKRKYHQVVGEWLANGKILPAPDVPITITELCVAYMKRCDEHYRKNGEHTTEYPLAKGVIKEFRAQYGDTLADDFGPIRFKAFRKSLVDRGLVRSTVNHYMNHVLGVFQLALENELVGFETYHGLKAIKRLQRGRCKAKEGKKRLPAELDRVEATLPFLSEVVADMVRLQILTGMRPDELCQIRPVDIDRSQDVWVYVPRSHKTEHHDHERLIHIGPEGQTVLTKYLLRDQEQACFSPAESAEQMRQRRTESRVTPMSCGNTVGSKTRKKKPKRTPGQAFTTDSYRRAISRACAKAFPADNETKQDPEALKKWEKQNRWSQNRWSPNQLRKLTATTIRQHCDLESAQIILGHSNRSTTEKWYAMPYIESAAEVMRKLG